MANILRWVPFDMDERELRNRIKNKMIRPTTIPQTLEELVFEQAVAREALRLAYRAAQGVRDDAQRRAAAAHDRRHTSARRRRRRRSSTT